MIDKQKICNRVMRIICVLAIISFTICAIKSDTPNERLAWICSDIWAFICLLGCFGEND